MPQDCQFVGVNSVTNIELDRGVLPAPIIRNADWFETLTRTVLLPHPPVCKAISQAPREVANYARFCETFLLENSGKWPIR